MTDEQFGEKLGEIKSRLTNLLIMLQTKSYLASKDKIDYGTPDEYDGELSDEWEHPFEKRETIELP